MVYKHQRSHILPHQQQPPSLRRSTRYDSRRSGTPDGEIKICRMAKIELWVVYVTRTRLVRWNDLFPKVILTHPQWTLKALWRWILIGPWQHPNRWSPNWSIIDKQEQRGKEGNKGIPSYKRKTIEKSWWEKARPKACCGRVKHAGTSCLKSASSRTAWRSTWVNYTNISFKKVRAHYSPGMAKTHQDSH